MYLMIRNTDMEEWFGQAENITLETLIMISSMDSAQDIIQIKQFIIMECGVMEDQFKIDFINKLFILCNLNFYICILCKKE